MSGFNPLCPARKLKKSGGVGYEDKKSVTFSNNDVGVPVPFIELIGLEVVDRMPGRMFLSTPLEKPSVEGVLLSGVLGLSYETFDGLLSRPCLLLGGQPNVMNVYCPTFFKAASKYHVLMYAFEEVTDTMGLGLTFSKGWYAVNAETFENEPFDPEAYPLFYLQEYIEDDATSADAEAYVKGMFSLQEKIAFTVKAENIYSHDSLGVLVSYANISTLEYISEYGNVLISFGFDKQSNKVARVIIGTTTITYIETIHPIDPKYLPGVCLPVVEITSAEYAADNSAVSLSEDESAQFTAAVATGQPVVVKVPFSGNTMVLVTSLYAGMLIASAAGMEFLFAPTDSGWVMGG